MFYISLLKLSYDINYRKRPKNSYFIQFYYHYLAKPKTDPMNLNLILFKIQKYLCLVIFEKPMV